MQENAKRILKNGFFLALGSVAVTGCQIGIDPQALSFYKAMTTVGIGAPAPSSGNGGTGVSIASPPSAPRPSDPQSGDLPPPGAHSGGGLPQADPQGGGHDLPQADPFGIGTSIDDPSYDGSASREAMQKHVKKPYKKPIPYQPGKKPLKVSAPRSFPDTYGSSRDQRDSFGESRDSATPLDGRIDAPAAGGARAGVTCAGPDGICLGLKYVSYKNPDGQAVVSERGALHNIESVNRIWKACGIQFQIDQYEAIDPEEYSLQYQTAEYGELNEIRRDFADRSSLLVVTTGPWDREGSLGNTGANAWTNLPGEGLYGAILEQPVARFGPILAHELGHYLSLDHVDDPWDLMSPVIYRDSSELSAGQCEAARWAASTYWRRMSRAT